MRTSTISTIAAIALLTPGLALADHDRPRGRDATSGQPIAIEAMQQKIDALGYDVRRLRISDRGFEAHIVDRASGGVVETRFDAAGDLLRAKLED